MRSVSFVSSSTSSLSTSLVSKSGAVTVGSVPRKGLALALALASAAALAIAVPALAKPNPSELDNEAMVTNEQLELAADLPQTTVIRTNLKTGKAEVLHLDAALDTSVSSQQLVLDKAPAFEDVNSASGSPVVGGELDTDSSQSSWRFQWSYSGYSTPYSSYSSYYSSYTPSYYYSGYTYRYYSYYNFTAGSYAYTYCRWYGW